MITLSILLRFIASLVIVVVCMVIGLEIGGRPVGGILGIVLGVILGWASWRILARFDGQAMVRNAKKEFGDKSVEELRELLREGKTMTPNLILVALMLRGENIDQDIFPVFDFLESDVVQRRSWGYAALRTGYPYLTQFIHDYSPVNSHDVCRDQVVELRSWVEEQLLKAQQGD